MQTTLKAKIRVIQRRWTHLILEKWLQIHIWQNIQGSSRLAFQSSNQTAKPNDSHELKKYIKGKFTK